MLEQDLKRRKRYFPEAEAEIGETHAMSGEAEGGCHSLCRRSGTQNPGARVCHVFGSTDCDLFPYRTIPALEDGDRMDLPVYFTATSAQAGVRPSAVATISTVPGQRPAWTIARHRP